MDDCPVFSPIFYRLKVSANVKLVPESVSPRGPFLAAAGPYKVDSSYVPTLARMNGSVSA